MRSLSSGGKGIAGSNRLPATCGGPCGTAAGHASTRAGQRARSGAGERRRSAGGRSYAAV
ncbi:hypothetical protein [Paenibacillus amylolyticus]|uniref:hypothetical protein n=1 Tax=Paenibacillus amylolyticus TaxID=1451 RepID=UPI001EFF9D9A|nr:hypothetical protein [Paenibacillus amylolyticus]